MPTVTRLEPHPTRRETCVAYLDGEPWLTLPTPLAAELGLVPGRELSAGEAEVVASEAARRLALDAALAALAARRRSRSELARHLRGRGHPAAAIEAALARVEELGYVDDRAFAAAFARDRLRLRPRGLARIRGELRQRGVAEGDAEAGIAEALAEEGTSETDLLESAARRRWRALRGLDPTAAGRRLAAYLLRRGFPPGAVRDAVRRLSAGEPGGEGMTRGGEEAPEGRGE